MVRMPWATYLWPGLPQLWRQGLWWGLALAVGFGILLNLLVMASFVWVELLGPVSLKLAWLAMSVLWLGSAAASVWHSWGVVPRVLGSAEAMFRTALSEYLKGNWFEAERTLGRLLEVRPRDVEARLLLATLLRHNGRLNEALEQLARLELLEDARRWAREIEVERQAIAERMAENRENELNQPASEQPPEVAAETQRAA